MMVQGISPFLIWAINVAYEKSHGSWGWIVIDCARVILFSGINKLYRKGRFHSWGFGLF